MVKLYVSRDGVGRHVSEWLAAKACWEHGISILSRVYLYGRGTFYLHRPGEAQVRRRILELHKQAPGCGITFPVR